jgi:hypothetical protein
VSITLGIKKRIQNAIRRYLVQRGGHGDNKRITKAAAYAVIKSAIDSKYLSQVEFNSAWDGLVSSSHLVLAPGISASNYSWSLTK